MSDTIVSVRPYIIGSTRTDFIVPAGSTALGIGDVVSGATFYAGLRVYSTAQVGHNFGFIKRSSDNANTNLLVYGANGYPDLSNVDGLGHSLSVWRDLAGAATLTMDRLYEQISNTVSGSGSAVPLTIVNEGAGVLVLGSDTNTTTFSWNTVTGVITTGHQFTLVGTGKHKSGAGNSAIIGSNNGTTTYELVNLNAANSLQAYQATSATPVNATASDDAWHGMVGVLNGASSFITVDGVQSSIQDTGSAADIETGFVFFSGFAPGTNPYQGRFFETAIYGSALSFSDTQKITTNITAMIAATGLP